MPSDRVKRRIADGEAGRALGASLTESIRKRAQIGAVHLIGERGVRTWCDLPVTPALTIADRRPDATCEACIEIDQMRQIGIASGTYKHPADLKLDQELGDKRPMTLGT